MKPSLSAEILDPLAAYGDIDVPDLIDRLYSGTVPFVVAEPDGRQHTVAPTDSVVLAASFNPLHRGHSRLLSAAEDTTGQRGCFELSIENVDKPRLSQPELRRRLRQFVGLSPVMVTNAPTFVQKSRLAPGSVFVTGVDTAERLFVDRYYDRKDRGVETASRPSPTAQALDELRRNGCRLLVAGRVIDGRGFVTLDDLPVPPEFEDLFEAIPESSFREDISSTAVRDGSQRGD